MAVIDIEIEKREILRRYRSLLRSCAKITDKQDKANIRKAFDIALEAHKDTRRKSGEPYIYHPISVAQIAVSEIGLGATAVICALLHDVVEDTDISLDYIEYNFGKKVTTIIDGLTKISGVFDHSSSLQAENFRKMLLTLSDDVRVILIKLADRLDNMRTLDYMPVQKQLKIASETLYLYAPLAHRLGLYNIKTELEDLGLKYTEPEIYESITHKLKKTQAVRTRFINSFVNPIKRSLNEQHLTYEIKGRPKSLFSIWNKMKNKGIPFEEVYDLFAIRIIIDTNPENEKSDCWKVYSIVTDYYTPSPERLRDWISTPKANGYESLHTTVMSPTGKWVEVQIRTKRMDEIAEKGYAAHWKYKESGNESNLDEWINKIRDLLEKPDGNALDFMDDFKLNLFAEEIYVFTPKGELKTLPQNATALDFAFDIHTDVGLKCIGAKVNQKLVPLSYMLKSGDQVEVITSKKQEPKEDWLKYVITAKAKAKIKDALKSEKKKIAKEGKIFLEKKLHGFKIPASPENLKQILSFYKITTLHDLFYRIAVGNIELKKLKELNLINGKLEVKIQPAKSDKKNFEKMISSVRGLDANMLVIGENLDKIEYKLSPCCSPIPGDDVFGFVTINEGIKIHRINCPNAIELMSNYGYRIVKARWTSQELIAFLAGIKISGIDNVGIVNRITQIISEELNVNMRSIGFESHDGVFEGIIMVYVHDTNHLKNLTAKLKKVYGVTNVDRIDYK
ncbi:MAG: bifunctional (p)ppGpp synthetase/guanosine-3',5'-bis(diphosphate) 3'-pyrophosphohydrolase [Bacteroidetes bacterium]|nr:bifunctional (p)ppGpp synthetase/guanosine-3',5'-bis(diphosphate) 3'-pyrophosphohydrolase [Bacteroidota bacterium]HET6245108.1 RelA/SpoT family protein [Bacteroidia bacterium]